MNKIESDHELPECIASWGWKFHHIGIPTEEKIPDERYIPHLKFYVSGFPTSPFGVEWMRFDDDCPVHPLIQRIPHIAFVVKDLDYELANRNFNLLGEPNTPSGGLQVAMIEHNGAPIELMEFENNILKLCLQDEQQPDKIMNKIRLDHEFAQCIEEWGWKYHHLGIPTKEQKENERYFPQFKSHISEFDSNPFGIEWMRFEQDCKIQELIQKIPHIAFEAKDLDWELKNRGFNVISPPSVPSDSVRAVMIEYNGAPVQLIEFEKNR
ncbi:VOC family protein [Dysgonomonas reticulitermitis]